MSQKKINAFLELLINAKVGNQVYSFNHVDNPYAKGENSNQYRNLKQYLTQMHAMKPTVLLVGEAPGYNGCKLTGIPFTSEFTIYDNKFPLGNSLAFIISDKKQKERTSTIFWKEINELNKNKSFQLPLLWNIFPYHPYEHGNPEKSNRAPLKDEIDFGFVVLTELLSIFDSINIVYAIGIKAKNKLMVENGNSEIIALLNNRRNQSGLKTKIDTEKIYIMHPSYRGVETFKKDIKKNLIKRK